MIQIVNLRYGNQYKYMKGFYKEFDYKDFDYTNTFRMKGGITN